MLYHIALTMTCPHSRDIQHTRPPEKYCTIPVESAYHPPSNSVHCGRAYIRSTLNLECEKHVYFQYRDDVHSELYFTRTEHYSLLRYLYYVSITVSLIIVMALTRFIPYVTV